MQLTIESVIEGAMSTYGRGATVYCRINGKAQVIFVWRFGNLISRAVFIPSRSSRRRFAGSRERKLNGEMLRALALAMKERKEP